LIVAKRKIKKRRNEEIEIERLMMISIVTQQEENKESE